MTSTVRWPSVTIAMLTYQRPQDLGDALSALLDQVERSGQNIAVLVVDNDPDGSAAPMVEAYDSRAVRYVNETSPGIAAARNRALDEARESSVLIFIDDDERPTQDWLQLLMETYLASYPAAVVGPVLSEYDAVLDPWIEAGGFFNRRRLTTGAEVSVAATNNLLLDMSMINRCGLRFDERFGQSGGSDTLFSRELAATGGRMVWCDEAIVIDKVPLARLTRSWVLRRALRSGNSWSRTSMQLAKPAANRWAVGLRLGLRGGIRLIGGSGRLLLGVITGSASHQARGLRTAARGAGMVSGIFGYAYIEYKRPVAKKLTVTNP